MKVIDSLNKYLGWLMAMLVPLLVLELVYDTVARYVFNAPSEWSYDVTYMLYGAIFMLGAAHTLNVDKHVRIETIYGNVSTRKKAILDAVGYMIFFFPAISALVYYGSIFTLKSWRMGEVGGESMWQPPIYPFKAILPLAAFFLLLQGLVQFVRCFQDIKGQVNVDPES